MSIEARAESLLRRIVAAWREDEIGRIDGALIVEAEELLGIEAEPDPLEAGGAS